MVNIPTIYGDDWGMVYGIVIATLWYLLVTMIFIPIHYESWIIHYGLGDYNENLSTSNIFFNLKDMTKNDPTGVNHCSCLHLLLNLHPLFDLASLYLNVNDHEIMSEARLKASCFCERRGSASDWPVGGGHGLGDEESFRKDGMKLGLPSGNVKGFIYGLHMENLWIIYG